MAPTGNQQSQRKLLKHLSDQLSISDVGSMKFMCRGLIGAASLDKVDNEKAVQLFELLQQKCLISSTDLTYLQQLFIQIQRFDLAEQVPVSSGESSRDAVDSARVSGGRQLTLSLSGSSISPFRSLLKELADELTISQVEDIKFLIHVPGGYASKIHDGQSLLVYMEQKGLVSESNLDDLKDTLKDVHRMDLIERIENFSRTSTSPEASSSSHKVSSPYQQVTSPGSAYLMKPSDFLAAVEVPPQEQVPFYPIEEPVGYALIINNETFTGQTNDGKILTKRNGTRVDLVNLKDLWEKLGFQVEVHSNLKAHEILTVVQDMAKRIDGSSSSCFVCCLLSHGDEGAIYGSDTRTVEISSIMDFFKEQKCPALTGKPKLFFVQACRGQNKLTSTSACPVGTPETNLMPDASPPNATNHDGPDHSFRRSADPNESHFLLGYATPPGFVSWRSVTYGSWYVHALVETFSKYFEQEDVLSMMVRVNQKVSEAFSRQGYKQCPAPVVTLTKRIYFKNLTS